MDEGFEPDMVKGLERKVEELAKEGVRSRILVCPFPSVSYDKVAELRLGSALYESCRAGGGPGTGLWKEVTNESANGMADEMAEKVANRVMNKW
jgi:hypothetical protein